MEIRRLHADDAPAYRALRLRALQEHPEAFTSSFEEEQDRPAAWSARRLADGAAFWGAFDDAGALFGMVGLDREQRLKSRHKATVIGMYVAPEHGRGGAGRALMHALLDGARQAGIARLVLTVTRGNEAAQRLYLRCGFRSFGIEPGAIRVAGRDYDKDHMFLEIGLP